jgi:tyrosyl-tRNA synthetase
LINALALAGSAGLQPIAVIGGATGRIGDPSGRLTERPVLASTIVEQNTHALTNQIASTYDRIRDIYEISAPDPIILDNYEWYRELNILDYLSRAGGLRINTMMAKDSISNRGTSLTYAEFTYQLL